MANQAVTGRPVSQFNNNGLLVVEGLVTNTGGALGAGETLTVTVPDGHPKDMTPVAVNIWSTATPAVPIAAVLTSHNRTTGVTVITCANGAAVNSRYSVLYTTTQP